MKILIISHYFWPEQFRINDLALELKERGHEVTVLTGVPNYPTGKMFEGYSWWSKRRDNMQGVPVFRVPLFLRRQSRGWQLSLNFLSFVASACLLAPWYFRRQEFDVIFVYEPSPFTIGIPAALLRRLKGAPILFWVQDLWPESLSATGAVTSERILAVVGRVVRMIYRRCDRVLVQSRGFIEPAIRAGADRERIRYFPNWAEALYRPVDLPMDAPERKEVPADGFVVMFAGNLGAAQSLDTILDAAEILKGRPIHWVFLGDGRRRAWMQEQIESRLLAQVHLLGSRPMETMPAYFSLADAMLVTLRADPVMTTTIPGKVQSYLACGRPVIGALDGEGNRAIAESGAGFSVASGDAEGLAGAVLRMSEMGKAERQQMGEAALAYYRQNFDREPLVDQLEGWMQEMIGDKG